MKRSESAGGLVLGVTIACVMTAVLGGVATVCATDACAMKAFWKLDDGVSAPADATGNGFNGTPSGTLVLSTDVPNVGFTDSHSFSFDGNSSFEVNRPVQDDFTICSWIKTTADGGGTGTEHYITMAIVHAETAFIANDFGFGVNANGKLLYGDGDGGADYGVTGATTVNTGEWVHACVTRRKASGSMHVYVNGSLDGSGSGSTASLSSNPVMTIGFGTDGALYWTGLLDDIRVYDTVLTTAEIAGLAGGAGACFGETTLSSSSSSSSERREDVRPVSSGGGRRGGPGRGGVAPSLPSIRAKTLHTSAPEKKMPPVKESPPKAKARICTQVTTGPVTDRQKKQSEFACGK